MPVKKDRFHIPLNRQSRLSDWAWVQAESVRRFLGLTTTKEALEAVLLRFYTDHRLEQNPEFKATLDQVAAELAASGTASPTE